MKKLLAAITWSFFALPVPASAAAECAWVLWMERNGVYQQPSGAFPSIGERDKEVERLASDIRSSEGKYHGYEVRLGLQASSVSPTPWTLVGRRDDCAADSAARSVAPPGELEGHEPHRHRED
jgi:hypothetical protein